MAETVGKAKILIVDDIPGNIKTLAEILRDDYEILMATSGQKALDAVANNDVKLILLDVEMPDMDGYEVCRRLKADKQNKEQKEHNQNIGTILLGGDSFYIDLRMYSLANFAYSSVRENR